MSRNIIIGKKSYITQALHKFIKNVEDALLILQSLLIDKTKNIDIHYSDHKLIKYFYYPCIFNQARSISDIDQKYNKSDILTINYGL